MADDKSKAGRQLGATGETVRRNIRWIRDARGISGAELSQAVDRLGRPIPLLGIQRIEAGTRRVDVDDLMAIAVALGVSPASLLMPLRNDAPGSDRDSAVPRPGDEVQIKDLVSITGWHKDITASWVWDWVTAAKPLVSGTMLAFIRHGLPSWERERAEAEMEAAIQKRNREVHYGDVDGEG
ncbi:helix-turn-helix domain-containing protein [Mycobacteroides abscessus]|uniref:helix-turn-helix domain-containing protein n=1 Tax=Mycobacteroides abscessus TaxID=36809 RepID=UPI000C263AA2